MDPFSSQVSEIWLMFPSNNLAHKLRQDVEILARANVIARTASMPFDLVSTVSRSSLCHIEQPTGEEEVPEQSGPE